MPEHPTPSAPPEDDPQEITKSANSLNHGPSFSSIFNRFNDQNIFELLKKNALSLDDIDKAISELEANPQKATWTYRNGQTALHYAADYSDSADLINKLVDKAPNYLYKTDNLLGFTPLHCAVCNTTNHAIKARASSPN